MNLSAEASIVLSYVRSHAIEGFSEIGNDIGLPEHVVASACDELLAAGIISDYDSSEDSVEYVRL